MGVRARFTAAFRRVGIAEGYGYHTRRAHSWAGEVQLPPVYTFVGVGFVASSVITNSLVDGTEVSSLYPSHDLCRAAAGCVLPEPTSTCHPIYAQRFCPC